VQIKVGTALVEQKSVQIGRTCNQTGVQSDRTYCNSFSALGMFVGGYVPTAPRGRWHALQDPDVLSGCN
jgi:hypothetical protein